MARNVEIKARIAESNFANVREKARIQATVGPIELSQTDTFFETQQGRLKVREFGDGTAELIYYERPDREGPKISEYIRSACEPTVKDALAKAYSISGIVLKQREVFFVDQTRVHLDKVAGLGTFLELEVVLKDAETDDFGEAIANRLLDTLGVSQSDLISGAYVDLLAEIK